MRHIKLLLIALFVLPVSAMAGTNYFVDKTNVLASNTNAGTNPAQPWLTIGKAATTAVAGDTVTVMAGGSYDERVSPAASGTANNPITFIAGAGIRPKVRGFTLSKNYIVISGFEITNVGFSADNAASISISNTTGVQVLNNNINHTNAAGIAFGNSSFLRISGNQISFTGVPAFAGGGAAGLTAIFNQPCNDVLIEQNTISFVSDFFNPFGSRYVYRNNTLGPSDPTSAFHIDGMQNNAIVTNSLYEGNLFVDNVSSDNHFFLNQIAGSTGWIIRYNTTLRSKGGLDWRTGGHYFYNNTFLNNFDYQTSSFQILLTNSVGNVARNNIWFHSVAANGNPYGVGAGSTIDKDYDLFFNQGSPGEAHGINANPQFMDAANNNFAVQAASPARKGGGPLTTVHPTDTGSGTSLVVADVRFFQDGWAGISPDTIAVGNSNKVAQIVSINYATNTITLATPLNRVPGQPVWLFKKSDGAKVMYSNAADVGAVPFVDVNVAVETKADGTGVGVLPQAIFAGVPMRVFAVQRDASGNFIGNVPATWSLTDKKSGVFDWDMVPAADGKSADFTGHMAGRGKITAVAVADGLAGSSGVFTVVSPVGQISMSVETAADGSGSVVQSQTLRIGESVTGFAIQRDEAGNVVNVPADWDLNNPTMGARANSLIPIGDGDGKIALFTAQAVGTVKMEASFGGFAGLSGTLTVIPPPPGRMPPGISLMRPGLDTPVSGAVTVSAIVTDTTGVTGVQFKLDGAILGAELSAPPYSVTWNTRAVSNGAHTLSAVARNVDGLEGTSEISVTVSNPLPTSDYFVPSNGGVSFVTTDIDSPAITISHAVLDGTPMVLGDTAVSEIQTQEGSALTTAPVQSQAGIAIVGFRNGGVLVTEAGFAASSEIRSGRIYAEVQGPVNTGIALSNATNEDALISFYFTDAAGRDFGTGSYTLAANSQIAAFFSEAPFRAPSNIQGTFSFQSSVPIGALALRGLTNERNEFLITPLPVSPVGNGEPGPAILPHFADGGGYSTQIVLTNPGEKTQAGTVQFFGQGSAVQSGPLLTMKVNGTVGSTFTYSIQPHASFRFVTAGTDPKIQVGSVQIVEEAPISPFSLTGVPRATAIFSYRNQEGVTVSEAGVSTMPAGLAFRLYVESSGAGGTAGSIQSGVAITNTSSIGTDVSIELTRMDGTSSGFVQSVNVPAGGQIAKFLDELFPQLGPSFQGFARVSSVLPIAVTALRGRYNERSEFLFSATPPLNEAAGPTSQLVFPHIVSGSGYSTQMIVYGRTGSGRLYLFSQNGTARPSSGLALQK